METKTVAIKNNYGLHMRVAAQVVKICRKYLAQVWLSSKKCRYADACSVLSILLLGAEKDAEVTIQAEGVDAKKAVEEISELFTQVGGI